MIRLNANIETILFKGSQYDLVWLSPIKDFHYGAKVIVSQTQVALFYRDGICVGVLGPGTHYLETKHVWFCDSLLRSPKSNTMHAQIIFINKIATELDLNSVELVINDMTGPIFKLSFSGLLFLQIIHPRKIVEKLLGIQAGDEGIKPSMMKKTDLQHLVNGLITPVFKHVMAEEISSQELNVLEIQKHLLPISIKLEDKMREELEPYGLGLISFRIQNLKFPEDDAGYKRFKALRENQAFMLQEVELECKELIMRAKAEAERSAIYRNSIFR